MTPLAASSDEICSVHPGFAEISSDAPEAVTASAFRDPSSRAASGCSRLYTPAEPQQIPPSRNSTSSSPGMARSSARGCGGHPLRVPQVARVMVGRP